MRVGHPGVPGAIAPNPWGGGQVRNIPDTAELLSTNFKYCLVIRDIRQITLATPDPKEHTRSRLRRFPDGPRSPPAQNTFETTPRSTQITAELPQITPDIAQITLDHEPAIPDHPQITDKRPRVAGFHLRMISCDRRVIWGGFGMRSFDLGCLGYVPKRSGECLGLSGRAWP